MSGLLQMLQYERIMDDMNDPQSWYLNRDDRVYRLWVQCKVCSLEMNESHGLVRCLACYQRLHEECADKWFVGTKKPKECVYCKSTCWKAYKH